MKNIEAVKEIDEVNEKIKDLIRDIDYHEPKVRWYKAELARMLERKKALERIIVNNIKIGLAK